MRQRKFFCHLGLVYLIGSAFFATVKAQSAAPFEVATNRMDNDSLSQTEKRRATPIYNEQTRQTVQLDIEYYAGMAAYNRRHWTHAILTFERILAIDPNFRGLAKKLASAERNLKREKTENILARYYQDATLALERDDRGWARRACEKINQLNPNYRDVPALWADLEARTQPNNETSESEARFANNTALPDSLYRAGIYAYERGDWIQAVVNFEKLQLIVPGHGEANNRLAHAWEQLLHAPPAAESTEIRESRLQVGATMAGVTIVALCCFMGFRPTARARFQLWRGNDQAAAAIYEKLLTQNPHRVKLYAPLADIYLRLGRNDERALKAYKSVVHFNLATSRREEMNVMVAQNYLTEGRTDTDAIEVLEGALKAEIRKQNLPLNFRH